MLSRSPGIDLVGSPEFNDSTYFMEEGSDSTELDDGQSPQLLVESVIRGIGFTPVRQIGQGAFSRVFLARQQSLANRYVVVKAVQRSFEEADRLAELQHTNIVPIYSFHRSGSWSLLCMPYAGMVTLADYFDAIPDSNLRSGQSFVSTIQCARDITVQATNNQATNNQATDTAGGWSAQQTVSDENKRQRFESVSETLTPLHRDALALWFFSRIADALHHAHVRGILHGDIKPANLLIRNDGEPALLDFNLSQKFDDVEPEVIGGTLPYMSPETMRSLMGFDSHITVASDIYSLGVVLYQFLTGRLAYPPPRSAASIDIEVAIAQRESHIVWAESDKVSPAIQAIVEKCLARSVTQRYLSAEQLHDDLERERWNLPLKHARERSLRHRSRKWIARHPRATSAASVMAVAAAIIITMTLVVWKVAASNERLVAARTFHRFEADARNSSAQLLSIGRTGKANAIEKARLCLATYGVLDDEKWQEANAWRYLADADKATSLSLMTNLMLKISWSHIDRDAVSATETIDTSELEKSTALKSISLLSQEPFVSHAPLAIGLLRHSASRPTDL